MGLAFQYVWGTKVCLMGWSAYKTCSNENGIICFISASYFLVLLLATFCTTQRLKRLREIDGMEADYLRRLEEGLGIHERKTSEEVE
jgi:hypothetical protein